MKHFFLQRVYLFSFLLSVFVVCSFLIVHFSWKGNDGKGYTRIIQSDGKGYYRYLPDFIITQNPSKQLVDDRYLFEVNHAGVNKYFVGTAVSLLPFFIGTYCLVTKQADGYSPPFQKTVSLAALFYLLLGLFFFYDLLCMCGIHKSISILVSGLILFGTHLLVISILHPAFSHVYSFCFVTFFLWSCKKFMGEGRLFHAITASISFGMILLIRPSNGVILFAIPMLCNSFDEFKRIFRTLVNKKVVLWGVSIVSLILFIQSIAWYLQCKQWIVWSYSNEGFYFLHPQIWNVLFSFRKGFFIYTPLALLSLCGLIFIWRRCKKIFLISVFFLLLHVYLISSWWNWYYGPSFGHRAFIEFLPVYGLLLALLIDKSKSSLARRIIYLLCACFVFLNLVQSYQYSQHILAAENMNYEKYKFIFFKTDLNYSGCLGGDDDAVPFHKRKKLLIDSRTYFEKTESGWSIGQTANLDSLHHQVSDYREREFNSSFEYVADMSSRNANLLYAEVSFEKMDLQQNSFVSPLFVFDMSDKNKNSYTYFAFPVNDIPRNEINVWRKMKYTIQIPKFKNLGDQIKLYIWNKERQSFYLDNFEVQLFAIEN